MKIHHFLAFDIGATSGRTILAKLEDKKLTLKELTRFPNKIFNVQGKFYWDIYVLFEALKDGLKAAAIENVKIDALGIDTWGVDFAYIGEDGSILGLPRSYRDPYTNGMPEKYFDIIPKKDVYDLTGIQIMNFNSLYQLFSAKQEGSSALGAAKEILFMPDALSYLLSGKKVCEYTIASTSQLLNPKTKKFEAALFEAMGVSPSIMGDLVMPGEIIGKLSSHLQKECRIDQEIPVVAVAGHDTASAVASVPAENKKIAYLSSGTWSLMGIEVEEPIINEESYNLNFTNEGGVEGTTRFLKNITGMWLLEQCRKEWSVEGKDYSYPEIVALSESTKGFQSMVDPDDPSFANPDSMTEAIINYCKETKQKAPSSHAEFIRCIFDSLALKYKYVLECLQKVAPFEIEKLHVIGGGSQNKLLNQMTANSIGIPVVAGPAEATAIGNIMLQAKGVGLVNSLQEMRDIIRQSLDPEVYYPQNIQDWNDAYVRFLNYSKIKNIELEVYE